MMGNGPSGRTNTAHTALVRVQPDVVALRVAHAGKIPMAARNLRLRKQNQAASLRYSCEHIVQIAIAVQIDHCPGPTRPLKRSFHQGSASPGRLRGKHCHWIACARTIHFLAQDLLVEICRPVQVFAGNLEPVDRVLSHCHCVAHVTLPKVSLTTERSIEMPY